MRPAAGANHTATLSTANAPCVAAQLRSSYFEFTDRGHFVGESTFPAVVEFVKRTLGTSPSDSKT